MHALLARVKKMNNAMVYEILKIVHPNIFSIPSETEIKQELGLLFPRLKGNKEEDENNTDTISIFDSEPYLLIVNHIVDQDKTEKPKMYTTLFYKL